MAKERERDRRQKRNQIGFQESDLQWLAERFQKQAAKQPDLTLEEFAIHHGVQPKWISRFIDAPPEADEGTTMSIGQVAKRFDVGTRIVRQWIRAGALQGKLVRGIWRVHFCPEDLPDEENPLVNLWHGTTEDRARDIKAKGFRALGAHSRAIWFTKSPRFAKNMANHRAKARGEPPVVISCGINLKQYSVFMRPSPHVYVFYTPIGQEVIKDISIVEEDGGYKKSKREKGNRNSIDITLTKASGKMGVLAWMDSYLEQEGKGLVSEDHPAVDAIWQWVETQYVDGRDDPISDAEMLVQVTQVLNLE
ncbi:hypothetical protein IH992_15085 [Candidatus Poribacteria bacterium]|nr:hypothetical protein [Candidatus Poribacteria bacterium]